MERYWRREINFRKSGGKSKRTKSKSSEEDRKQRVSHLKTERKNEYWILFMIEIFKSNLEQKMYWENKYSKERKEDLQSYDSYFTSWVVSQTKSNKRACQRRVSFLILYRAFSKVEFVYLIDILSCIITMKRRKHTKQPRSENDWKLNIFFLCLRS